MGSELIRVCGIGILCAVSGLVLRQKGDAFAGLLRVAAILCVLGILVFSARDVLHELDALLSDSTLAEYASVMLKAIGIAVLCTTCGDVCRECGQSSVATGVELCGNLAILALCFPLIGEILGHASELMSLA